MLIVGSIFAAIRTAILLTLPYLKSRLKINMMEAVISCQIEGEWMLLISGVKPNAGTSMFNVRSLERICLDAKVATKKRQTKNGILHIPCNAFLADLGKPYKGRGRPKICRPIASVVYAMGKGSGVYNIVLLLS